MDLDIPTLLLMVVPLILAITIHEAAHGYMANYLGDNTAKLQGRLSLSPLRHIDPIGTIAVPLIMFALSSLGGAMFIFGWAKPVPFDPRNFQHPRRDIAWTAFAGPLSNLIQAFIWAVIIGIIVVAGYSPFLEQYSLWEVFWRLKINEPSMSGGLFIMAKFGVMINIFLMVLNLMPIPPLDGGRIVTMALPYNVAREYEKIEPYGFFIIIGLLYFNILPLSAISSFIIKMILSIIGIFF